MIFVKNKNTFLSYVFFDKITQKRLFLNILYRKHCFSDKKNEFLKKTEKSKFSKGVNQWFLSKNRDFFLCAFLSKISQKRLLSDSVYILYRKKCLLD